MNSPNSGERTSARASASFRPGAFGSTAGEAASLGKRYAASTVARAAKLNAHKAAYTALPKRQVVRSFCMNHLIHHRAQLGVYLRLLDVPVPATYGPSADDEDVILIEVR